MTDGIATHVRAREMLEGLSGNCGKEPWDQGGFLISNDRRFHEVFPTFKKCAREVEEGLALFIGQGAVFSLLPHIRTKLLPVVVDINPAVPAFAEIVQNAILTTTKPAQTIANILDAVATAQGTERPFSTPDFVKEELGSERRNFGALHWSVPSNFEVV